jgi:hypothetical protein
MRNKSLKSELTNILTLDFHVMNNQFPGGVKPRPRGLGLPEFQVKGPIQVGQFAATLNDVASHGHFIGLSQVCWCAAHRAKPLSGHYSRGARTGLLAGTIA